MPHVATTSTLPLSQGGIIILEHIWVSYVHHSCLEHLYIIRKVFQHNLSPSRSVNNSTQSIGESTCINSTQSIEDSTTQPNPLGSSHVTTQYIEESTTQPNPSRSQYVICTSMHLSLHPNTGCLRYIHIPSHNV